MIFSDITKSDMETDKMYEEITKEFKKVAQPEITELEQMPELTNLNKWVQGKSTDCNWGGRVRYEDPDGFVRKIY